MSKLRERIDKIKGIHQVKKIAGEDWKIPNLETAEVAELLELQKDQDPKQIIEASKELLRKVYKLNFPEETEEDLEAAIKETPINFINEVVTAITSGNGAG